MGTFTRPDGRRAGKPTCWKGRWFRSVLESIWAECWDAAGIVWSYEPRRVQLGGDAYLIDFYLPGLGVYVEVKPVIPTVHERDLCKQLAILTGLPVYLVVGKPWVATSEVCRDGLWSDVDPMELFGVKGKCD
jgi:hypothetical protein